MGPLAQHHVVRIHNPPRSLLFHELAHQLLYVRNDSSFNEAYAEFVEPAGVRAWLELNQQQDELQRWLQLKEIGTDFAVLVMTTRGKLAKLYAGDLETTAMRQQKAETFHVFEQESSQAE